MAERAETRFIKSMMDKVTKKRGLYGCEEVTIGFRGRGMGNEIADYMTMDSKGKLSCYEIKVTMQDLKSTAKKSFYAHKNYLVVTEALYEDINRAEIDLEAYGIPLYVGIMTAKIKYDENGNPVDRQTWDFWSCERKPIKKDISIEDSIMLKESLIRSMFWKMDKYRTAASDKDIMDIHRKNKDLEKENHRLSKEKLFLQNEMFFAETELQKKYGRKFPLCRCTGRNDWIDLVENAIKIGHADS